MGKVMVVTAVGVALALGVFGLVGAAMRPRPEPPQLVSMTEAGQAMIVAGGTMQSHGQAMVDQGRRTGDQDLVAYGDRWVQDGQQLVQRGQWMIVNPLAPGNLVTAPSQLSRQGAWGDLTQRAEAMVHDPGRAPAAVDLQALRLNGLAMEAEGRTMADHGRLMKSEVDFMQTRHGLDAEAANALGNAAQAMLQVGGELDQNGQAMVDYADGLSRSLGYP
jgi:hypothetical protein